MVTIYVLKLRTNKYYVGKTTNPTYRLDDHFSEGGSAWTKKYKPISIHELQPDRPDTDEQIITQQYMDKYGIDNVRGGPWCKINLSDEEKQCISQINKGNADVCYNCGSNDHFANQCKNKRRSNKISKGCKRCGRKNHKEENCYATTDIYGTDLESESSDSEVWACSKCGKEFDTYKGASYHERFHCKISTWSYSSYCKKCGRKGHTKSNCYADTHVRGYQLYY